MIMTPPPDIEEPTTELAKVALHRAVPALLRGQRQDGRWVDEIGLGTAAVAQKLLLRHVLGIRTAAETSAAGALIRSRQRPDGSWAEATGAGPDRGATIQAYVALRLCGDPPDAYHMALAAGWIRDAGGLPAADAATLVWLAACGAASWHDVPAMSRELLKVADWTAAMTLVKRAAGGAVRSIPAATAMSVPLVVVGSPRRAGQVLPFELTELTPPGLVRREVGRMGHRAGACNRVRSSRLPSPAAAGLFQVSREAGRRRSAEWIMARQETDGSWSDLMLPTALSVVALSRLGHGLGHPAIVHALGWLDRASDNAVDSTLLAVAALTEAGLEPDHPAVARAAAFLKTTHSADAGHLRRVTGLGHLHSCPLVLPRLVALQDGEQCACCVAKTVATLADSGQTATAAGRRGVVWLLRAQRGDGSWPGCRGMDSVAVTALVLRGLVAAGVRPGGRPIRSGVGWLVSRQHDDGAWQSEPDRGDGMIIIRTAIAVIALLDAGGEQARACAGRGIRWLSGSQSQGGDWAVAQPPGGSPDLGRCLVGYTSSVGYPILALSRYLSATK